MNFILGAFLLAFSSQAHAKVEPVGVDLTHVSTTTSIITAAAGDTIIKTPTSGKRLRLKHVYYTNLDAFVASVVKFRFGTGAYFWQRTMNVLAEGNFNLVGANIEGQVDEPFVVNLAPALVVGVEVTIIYDEI